MDWSSLILSEQKIDIQKEIQVIYLNLPLELKVKFYSAKKSEAYFIFGGQYTWDMASNAKKKPRHNSYALRFATDNFYINTGVGVSLKKRFFRFSIELMNKYSLFDNLVHDGTIYTESIESIKTDIIQLTFSFD